MHVNESEQELPVDETQENEKDATGTGDDKIDDARNNATENGEDDKIDDHKNDATEIGDDDKIDDSKNDATKIGDDEKIDGSKIDDSNDGVTEIGQDDKTDDNKNEATETGADDKIDDRDNTINELHQQLVTHNTIVKHSPSEIEDRTLVTMKNEVDTEMDDGYDSGTPEAQEAFMQEVLALYKTKHLKFTVPKFYGRYLNCLNEQELPVDETQENEKDATGTGDDKIDDARNNATENGEDDKIDDHKNDATEIGDDDKIDDSKNDATKIGDDEKIDGSKIDDSNDGVTEIGQDDKTDDNKNEATETGADDKIDDSKKDEATAMDDDDDRIHDGKNDATDMDNDHGVLDDTENDGTKNIPENNDQGDNTINELHQQLVTHNTIVKHSPSEIEDRTLVTMKNEVDTEMDDGYDSGTPEAQEAFMQEVLALYKTKHLKFTVPKFYGRYLNCLKLWKAVIRLGGYDRVTATKGWRYVGEAFRPPKTCTTVSWTFRQFYEKSLLEYERHKVQTGELELPLTPGYPETPTVEHETNGHQTPTGSGRARRDAAARAMQGWHSHRLLGFGEEKNSNNSQKREKSLKSLGSLKHKRQSEVEHSAKALRTETSRQLVTTVADIGPPANWVKINVRETKDCFEVYALVPGLLREEVRVQSDPAGRLVITGQPEQLDNPWGISSFKKVISLPARIDPLRTSAIVSLHGRLLVKVPFEQSNI
ncbi:ARID DNA-binding domain, HSP20-like chaperone [Artemisia annua]|uniref:ARID DNA-binding domain, HSP20-like chaperone n=1 Tax=Artemisia annua TaxID=35608 RepID=A0A2U1P5L0_ARTAN|nr:ARID DNA-binding domain, HSP20-like chaperone [Artemisia annua]